MENASYAIAMIICLIVLIGAIALAVWGFTRDTNVNQVCTLTTQCNSTQKCESGHCNEINCKLNSDCGKNQICSNGFCYEKDCRTIEDCPSTELCFDGLCTPYGQGCTGNQNCGSLLCINSKCGECKSNNDCSNGYCGADGACYPTCNANVNCGTTGICVNGNCCQKGFIAKQCKNTTDCGSNMCVNGVCSCKPGNPGDHCTSNTDCDSKNCLGGICLASGANCFYNYDPNNITSAHCKSDTPYCSLGQCSASQLGAPCSCFEFNSTTISNTCTLYTACNSGVTGSSTSYCINNVCEQSPGWYNDICTTSFDCSLISGTIPNCSNGRCV